MDSRPDQDRNLQIQSSDRESVKGVRPAVRVVTGKAVLNGHLGSFVFYEILDAPDDFREFMPAIQHLYL